jgi:hypothetical protein
MLRAGLTGHGGEQDLRRLKGCGLRPIVLTPRRNRQLFADDQTG